MQQRVSKPAGPSEVDVLKEGVNLLVEAHLASIDQKQRRAFLGEVGRRLNDVTPRPIRGISEAEPTSPVGREMRAWLQERLSVWVGLYER